MCDSFSLVYVVVDKTGATVSSTIWLISPNAASMSKMRQIGWLAAPPVLSITHGLSSLAKIIQKTLFLKKKISFLVVKSLVVRSSEPPPLAVYRIMCYLSSRLSLNVFGENIKKSNIRRQKPKIFKNFKIFQNFGVLNWYEMDFAL